MDDAIFMHSIFAHLKDTVKLKTTTNESLCIKTKRILMGVRCAFSTKKTMECVQNFKFYVRFTRREKKKLNHEL